jgi:hypothetical protein
MSAIALEQPKQSFYFETTWLAIVATALVVLAAGAISVHNTNEQQVIEAREAAAVSAPPG